MSPTRDTNLSACLYLGVFTYIREDFCSTMTSVTALNAETLEIHPLATSASATTTICASMQAYTKKSFNINTKL